ncbi:MAG: hypothetical protein H6566_06695 [Lewinellaceae bacterium]|nr:hypothetical protein [Lewinellaceae bacterium]
MKKHIILFCLALLASGALSAQEEIFVAKLSKEKVPAVVIASVEQDFPDAVITEYKALPITVLEDGWVITKEKPMDGKYDTYYLSIKGKNFEGEATYDANGNLISSQEYARNIEVPQNIARAIGVRYPGWGIGKDHMVTTFYKDGKQKAYYHIDLMKGAEHEKVVFDGHGNEVKHGKTRGKEREERKMREMKEVN